MWKVLPPLWLVAICAGVPVEFSIESPGPAYAAHGGHKVIEYYSHPKYQFKYGVADHHTGDIKSQEESRDGDAVKGYYTLHEADGTTRTVHYTADKHNGFNAVVERTGHAQHPQVQHAAAPIVVRPQPHPQPLVLAPLHPVHAAPLLISKPAVVAAPAIKAAVLSPVLASYIPPHPARGAHDPPHGYRTTIGLGAFRSSGYYH